MHAPGHSSVLPDHLNPMPMPDTKREAELLVFFLDSGVYPKIVIKEGLAEDLKVSTT